MMWINAALLNQMARRCNYRQSQRGPGDPVRQTVMKPWVAAASGVLETNKFSLGKWMFLCYKTDFSPFCTFLQSVGCPCGEPTVFRARVNMNISI